MLSVGERSFAFFSNDKNESTSLQRSELFEFEGEPSTGGGWKSRQKVATDGAHAAEFFSSADGSRHFLAVANLGDRDPECTANFETGWSPDQSGAKPCYRRDSVIYAFDPSAAPGEEPLSVLQTLPTFGATDFIGFEVGGVTFLAVSNEQDDQAGGDVGSTIWALTSQKTKKSAKFELRRRRLLSDDAAAASTDAAHTTAEASPRDAGILYEIWHTAAAHLMHRVAAAGVAPLTVEAIIRSDGKRNLGEVFNGPKPEIPKGYEPDIYNVEPTLGFYCLYRPRKGENATAETPVCPNITSVARQHAAWLTSAGFDYVTVDITNWPVVGIEFDADGLNPDTAKVTNDMTILRPLEVLAEEWIALRAQGVKTPSISAWPRGLCGTSVCMETSGPQRAMWRWVLDFYKNPKYESIIYRRPDDGKKLLFIPSPMVPVYSNASFKALLSSNGGKNDVGVQEMWAMSNDFAAGSWGFFSSCTVPCPTPPPPPIDPALKCPTGQRVDWVAAAGDNGSCDCASFCASDWAKTLKAARPHWSGATTAVRGSTTMCLCVNAEHWCPHGGGPSGASCQASCSKVSKPTAKNYCVKDTPAPAPGGGRRCPTTSMVDVGDCAQRATVKEDPDGTGGGSGSGSGGSANFEISASGAYMAAQCALPFASPGHLRGLTMQRLFQKVLDVMAPHLFMSSFNEFIGGRQASAYPNAITAINMGLPYDAQNRTVWVDTYASEFSR